MMEIITTEQNGSAPEATPTTVTIKTHVVTFLMFAEYMGYMSEFIEDVDKWVEGTAPKPFIQAFLNVEARDILTQMQKDYEEAEIHQWWNEFYPLVLFKSEDALKKMTKKSQKLIL